MLKAKLLTTIAVALSLTIGTAASIAIAQEAGKPDTGMMGSHRGMMGMMRGVDPGADEAHGRELRPDDGKHGSESACRADNTRHA